MPPRRAPPPSRLATLCLTLCACSSDPGAVAVLVDLAVSSSDASASVDAAAAPDLDLDLATSPDQALALPDLAVSPFDLAGRDFSGTPTGMVLIPGGTFTMGAQATSAQSPSYDFQAQPDEQPHSVTLSAYWLDATEVTVAAYAACAGCSRTDLARFPGCNWGVAGRESHPINCVDWHQASTYCESEGKRLPTEAEWEYAARGATARRFPWGDAQPVDGTLLCWSGGNNNGKTSTCPVATWSPIGDGSFAGISDLAGNVYEWVYDWYDAGYYATPAAAGPDPTGPDASIFGRVMRGGPWEYTWSVLFRGATRARLRPTNRANIVGFRCARTR